MLLKIKVLPKSSRTEITGTLPDGTIKIKLKSPPVDGEANEELIKFLSKHYSVTKKNVIIKKGLKNKNKIIEITNY